MCSRNTEELLDDSGIKVVIGLKQTEQARVIGAQLPSYSRKHDAGIDLRSVEEVAIAPGQRCLVGTGIQIAIPPGFVGFIKDRSGLASNHGIHTLAGVVDANYRGEVKVVLFNTSSEEFRVHVNDRIAQLVVLPVAGVKIELKNELDVTNRGKYGWGSTGVK